MRRLERISLVAAFALLALPVMAAANCRADLNATGIIDGTDLGILLGQWGPCPGCSGDFNGDGVVGCFDQEYLLGNWGKCPTCPADLNGSGSVDGADLGILLGSWGTDCRFDLDQNGIVDGNDADALQCLWGTSGPLGDFNGDGTVNGTDLGQVLGASGTDCSADLNHDGNINESDRLILTRAWGRCP